MVNYYGNSISWVPTLKESDKPKYLLIAQSIEDDIQSGKLVHGQKLPPQRLIASYLGLNHGTVTRAYKLCEERGIINGVVGKGTFVTGSAGLPVNMLTDHDDNNIISLGMALPLYETNDFIGEQVREVISSIDYNTILKYCPPEGHLKHRYIASNWMKDYKIEANPEDILITSGTQNALSIILTSMFSKSDRIIVDELTYTGLKSLAKFLGIILIPVKGDDGGINIEELEQTCKREKAKGIYLTPDCHNPTSITLSDERRKRISEIILKYNLFLIEDAIFSFCIENKNIPISAYIPENSFYMCGTSKAISPAFRIAYIVSPKKHTKRLQLGLNNLVWMASPYTAEIISLLQSTGRYKKIVDRKIQLLKIRNIVFDEEFLQYDSTPKESSMFRYVKLPDGWSDSELEHLSLEEGLQIFGVNRFSAGTNNLYNAIRISICSTKSVEELREGLKILKNVFETYENRFLPIV